MDTHARSSTRRIRIATLVLASIVLGACGGAGGGETASSAVPSPQAPPAAPAEPAADPETEPASGLDDRAPLVALRLPKNSPGTGDYRLENAFPSLPAFVDPLLVAAEPGADRLWLLEQAGRVRAFAADPEVDSAGTILDISARMISGGELGLLGLAFDPDFPTTPHVFLHYTAPAPRRSVIARYRYDAFADRLDEASELIILEQDQPFSNHNGGSIAFGADGFLYLAFGDGGSGGDPLNNGQDPATLLGAMLRIDVSAATPAQPYRIPIDNPFLGAPGFRPEIWALGFRNPFRFSFDLQTGDLWLGDVGQSAREEIDLVRAGANHGWRRFEGEILFDASTPLATGTEHAEPVFSYGRDDGVAIIGGFVYRGSANPALFGRYVYSDFGSGSVWALTSSNGVATDNTLIATAEQPTALGEDVDAELLVVSRSGTLGRIVDAAAAGSLPRTLSATGLFEDLASLRPASGLVPYDVRVPFWSDGTRKRRWFAVPDDARIAFDPVDAWRLPVGSVTVKHFEIDVADPSGSGSVERRLETRLLVHGAEGWIGFTYRWREDGSDADLLTSRASEVLQIRTGPSETRSQRYEWPSRSDCLRCHTRAAGSTLGLRTEQLNRDFTYALRAANQVRTLDAVGYLDPPVGPLTGLPALPLLDDDSADVAARARAYLAVNCAQCHRPGGPTPVPLDLRRGVPDAQTGAIDTDPVAGDLGITNARIVAPGDPDASVLLVRMERRDGVRMPPIGSHVVDTEGAALIRRWIEGL